MSDEVVQERPHRRQIVWSTNPYNPDDYYADKLSVIEWTDTGDLCLELKIGGNVHRFGPLTKKMVPV